LKCTQDTDDEKKKIRSESVRFQNVHLRISNTFRKKIRQRMKLERTHSPTKKSKKTETTEETRKERLMLFLQENVCITKNEYIHLTGLTRHAAIDELNKFIRQGILRRRGISRSTVYINNIQH
jgi:predicted HTH transcriptional regulator